MISSDLSCTLVNGKYKIFFFPPQTARFSTSKSQYKPVFQSHLILGGSYVLKMDAFPSAFRLL